MERSYRQVPHGREREQCVADAAQGWTSEACSRLKYSLLSTCLMLPLLSLPYVLYSSVISTQSVILRSAILQEYVGVLSC